jgi:hypothetical protein
MGCNKMTIMTTRFSHTVLLLTALMAGSALVRAAEADKETPKVNKLLFMYEFFYLPFGIEFRVGRNLETVLPYVLDARGEAARLVEAHELVALDGEWTKVRAEWRTKSLLEFHNVPVGKSLRITQRLVSHHVPVTRAAVDTLPMADRASLADTLRGKSPAVVAAFYQLRFLKSLVEPSDDGKFNFFIVSASWCDSSREYRTLLETYFKKFPSAQLTLHSVVVEDPKRQIFDSRLMKELFPHPKRYTHETVPRFLAMQMVNGQPKIWEEGEALRELYDRFYANHRGFLAPEIKSFKATPGTGFDPALSSAVK